jgi:uncharacterized membrane protein
MSLESGRNLGGIGALLNIIPIPFLGVIGLILVLFGTRELSQAYNDERIYRNALYGVIFGLIATVVGGLVWGLFAFGINLANVNTSSAGFIGFLAGALLLLIIAFIFAVLEAYFLRNSFNILADRSGVQLFRTSGLLLLIGAILTIIFIGFILIFIAWILILVSFFTIPTYPVQQPPPQMTTPPTPPPPPGS